jgi:hypothetical protein
LRAGGLPGKHTQANAEEQAGDSQFHQCSSIS